MKNLWWRTWSDLLKSHLNLATAFLERMCRSWQFLYEDSSCTFIKSLIKQRPSEFVKGCSEINTEHWQRKKMQIRMKDFSPHAKLLLNNCKNKMPSSSRYLITWCSRWLVSHKRSGKFSVNAFWKRGSTFKTYLAEDCSKYLSIRITR